MEKNRIKRSLRVSFWDGVFASGMMGFTTDYFTPYAIALKAQISQVGLLNALPIFISSVLQLKSADLTEKIKSRKKVVLVFIMAHIISGIPLIFIPYLPGAWRVGALIIFVSLFVSLNGFAGPVWLSLMSDYLPPKKRGKYFGWRNKILGIIGLCCTFMAGIILHLSKRDILFGFILIFAIAIICRIISWYYLTLMYETPFRLDKNAYFTFWEFIRRARESNFVKFVLFVSSLSFSVYLASPFFSVFMLKDLKFGYITYTVLIATVSLISIVMIDRWGRHADKIGNLKILRVTSVFIALLPILWLFNHHPVYLVFVQMVSGFAWSGFNLCAINFIYDAAGPAKRTRCIAYYNFCNGLAICLGSLAGGFLIKYLPVLWGYKLLSLFLLSGICRFIAVSLLFPKVREVRRVEKVAGWDLFFSVIGVRSMSGATEE